MAQEVSIKIKLVRRQIPDPRKTIACYRLFRRVGYSVLNSIRSAYLLTSAYMEIDGLKTPFTWDSLLESE